MMDRGDGGDLVVAGLQAVAGQATGQRLHPTVKRLAAVGGEPTRIEDEEDPGQSVPTVPAGHKG